MCYAYMLCLCVLAFDFFNQGGLHPISFDSPFL